MHTQLDKEKHLGSGKGRELVWIEPEMCNMKKEEDGLCKRKERQSSQCPLFILRR